MKFLGPIVFHSGPIVLKYVRPRTHYMHGCKFSGIVRKFRIFEPFYDYYFMFKIFANQDFPDFWHFPTFTYVICDFKMNLWLSEEK